MFPTIEISIGPAKKSALVDPSLLRLPSCSNENVPKVLELRIRSICHVVAETQKDVVLIHRIRVCNRSAKIEPKCVVNCVVKIPIRLWLAQCPNRRKSEVRLHHQLRYW